MGIEKNLLYPDPKDEKRKHKLSRLVQSPNSYFMDVKCPNCSTIATLFSHSQTVCNCPNCSNVLLTPTGGKAKLSKNAKYRRKLDD